MHEFSHWRLQSSNTVNKQQTSHKPNRDPIYVFKWMNNVICRLVNLGKTVEVEKDAEEEKKCLYKYVLYVYAHIFITQSS